MSSTRDVRAVGESRLLDRLEETRLAWQRAQADPQTALADLEHAVASSAGGEAIVKLQAVAVERRKAADELLQRHITQIGKSS